MVGDHMEFLLGVLSAAAFFICLLLVYRLGQRSKRPSAVQKETNEEERRKAERMRKGFEQLMSYDVNTAVSGKKVT